MYVLYFFAISQILCSVVIKITQENTENLFEMELESLSNAFTELKSFQRAQKNSTLRSKVLILVNER